MAFILAKKQKMTQIFNDKGEVEPGTLVLAEPNKVGLIRTKEKDGYRAVQVSLGKKKKEFRLGTEAEAAENHKQGDAIDVSVFKEGDRIIVHGITKGKGFQGVVKRHGFHGGFRTHGQKHSEREPGSIGATAPQRVFKGTRMAGRMGGKRITVKNLRIVKVDKESNQLPISGAIPGGRGALLEIRSV